LFYKINEASSLSFYEYALLLASLECRLEAKKFDCSKCVLHHVKRKQNNYIKRQRKGCFEENIKVYRLEDIIYKKCLGNYNVNVNYFIDLFFQYEKGQVSVEELPNKTMEILQVIQSRINYKKNEK